MQGVNLPPQLGMMSPSNNYRNFRKQSFLNNPATIYEIPNDETKSNINVIDHDDRQEHLQLARNSVEPPSFHGYKRAKTLKF